MLTRMFYFESEVSFCLQTGINVLEIQGVHKTSIKNKTQKWGCWWPFPAECTSLVESHGKGNQKTHRRCISVGLLKRVEIEGVFADALVWPKTHPGKVEYPRTVLGGSYYQPKTWWERTFCGESRKSGREAWGKINHHGSIQPRQSTLGVKVEEVGMACCAF